MSIERSRRIKDWLESEVGADVIAMLDEQADEPKDELYEILSTSRGDSMAIATARRLATRSRALKKFKESLLDEARKAENRPQPERAG